MRAGRLAEVDLEHLTEEIEDLGKSQRSAVQSQLIRMLMHLIKQRVQPERRGSGWRGSITDARREILLKIEASPSLKRFARKVLPDAYRQAVKDAMYETQVPPGRAAEIPAECPWTLDELLEGNPE